MFYLFRITSICGEYYIGGRQFASLEDLVAYYTEFSDLLPGQKLIHPVAPDKVSSNLVNARLKIAHYVVLVAASLLHFPLYVRFRYGTPTKCW